MGKPNKEKLKQEQNIYDNLKKQFKAIKEAYHKRTEKQNKKSKKDDMSLKEKLDKAMKDLKKYHKLMQEETKQAFDDEKQVRRYQKIYEKMHIKIELHETK